MHWPRNNLDDKDLNTVFCQRKPQLQNNHPKVHKNAFKWRRLAVFNSLGVFVLGFFLTKSKRYVTGRKT